MRAALVLSAAALALLCWPTPRSARGLAPEAVARLAPEALAQRPVAALSLRIGERPELLYLRRQGRWRCATAYGAPVREARLLELVERLQGARGLVRASADEPFEVAGVIELGLHGPGLASDPGRDLVLGFELAPLPQGALARRAEGPWLELARDPTVELAWPADAALPPLVDDRLVSAAWGASFPGLARVFVDRADGTSLELAPDGEEQPWRVRGGGVEDEVLPFRLAGYLNYLLRVRIGGLADPRRAAELGLESPAARVTLATRVGEPVSLVVGRPGPQGTFVLNRATGVLGRMDADDVRLLAPDRAMLVEAERANPWERWLSR